jgi:hypothetical protein
MAIDKGFQWSSDPQMALRMQLAQGLMQGQQAPAQSLGENVANLSSKLVGAFMMKKAMDDGRGRDDARNATLANALQAGQGQAAETKSYGDGTTINWNERKADPNQMAAILASNRDTAPMGMQMQFGQMDAKAKGDAETARMLREHNLAIERDRLKPLDISDGKQWYIQDLPGQATAAPPTPVAPSGPDLRTASTAPNPPPVEQQPLAAALAKSESGGNHSVVNRQGYSGKYQFGEAAATAAGFYEPDDNPNDNKWNGKFKNLPGVSSYQDFLKNQAAQDQAFNMHQTHLDTEIEGRGLDKYIGQTVGGVPITRDGLVAMMHLGGPGGTEKFLRTNGQYNPADSGGTKLSDYGTKFAGGGAQPPAAPPAAQPPANTALAEALVPGSQRMTVGGQSGTVVGGGQSGPKVRSLTPDEVAQNGLPKGTVAQVNRDGQVTVVSKPDKVDGPGKNERDWRGEFKEPIKQATELTSQVGIVRNAAKVGNGTADTALIIAFNKLLDPGAVVREADVALTRQAQSVMEQVNTWMANKAEGDILPEQLRQRISGLTEQIYATSNSVLRDRVMPYREAAESEGANWDRIIPPKMRTSLGWDDQPDPNAWQTVDIPKDLQTPKPAATKLAGNVPTFATPDDPGLAALPSGTEFFDPNGVRRIKP